MDRGSESLGDRLRQLPAVHRLVDELTGSGRLADIGHGRIVDAARVVLEEVRDVLARGSGDPAVTLSALADRVAQRLETDRTPALSTTINGTGIIVHTGLGRAPLAKRAVQAVTEAAAGYVPVELDMRSGERGKRTHLVRDQLRHLTGAESATVVNNNAAAMLIALATTSFGREVIVSRGELIEIGGSFRLPEVMATSGCVLREVGATNRTRLADYEKAIGDATGSLMKAHPSNYRIEGFTEEVSIEALAKLGRQRDVPVIHDVGSGLLRPSDRVPQLADEPDVRRSVAAGADLVLFSGDKLLGGPQCGIIVGKAAQVAAIEKHPMMRAMRVDKLTLAALAATLQLHVDEQADETIPVWRMLTTSAQRLEARADVIVSRLTSLPDGVHVRVKKSEAYVGGGALPTHALPSAALSIISSKHNEDEIARRLRAGRPAVLARVRDGAVWIDLRTVFPLQDETLAAALEAALRDAG